jgi:hypothetical protein
MTRNYAEQKIHIQTAHFFRQLETLKGGFTFFHPFASGKCSPREASLRRALGVKAGVPDLVFFLPAGVTLMFELKAPGGRLSGPQEEFHANAAALGFGVHTIEAEDAGQAIGRIEAILEGHGWKKP